MTIHWKVVQVYFTVVLFLENVSVLELALSGVKGSKALSLE